MRIVLHCRMYNSSYRNNPVPLFSCAASGFPIQSSTTVMEMTHQVAHVVLTIYHVTQEQQQQEEHEEEQQQQHSQLTTNNNNNRKSGNCRVSLCVCVRVCECASVCVTPSWCATLVASSHGAICVEACTVPYHGKSNEDKTG